MTDRPDVARDEAIAAALEDFHRRKALGEAPQVDDYAGSLGASHAEFREIVATEERLDFAMTPPPLEPLPRTFDGYTLLRELGRGAAGVVYEALDRRLGRKVALKILRTGFDTDSTARERFRREAKECAHVRHDNIVPIFEAGEAEGRPFYAMDVVPGEPLSALIKAQRVPEPKALCAGLAGIANALEALHAAGIVHRDVKPQNVMVRPDGRMVLADFGLARSADAQRLTQTGDAVGTPLYMSPEQMLGQSDQVDERSDIWGLGVTLYEALAGRPPFQTDETAALIKMILSQQPEPIRKFAAHVPAECEGIALKAIQKEKGDRYATAAAMAEDLRAFSEGRPVLGRPIAPFVRAMREVRRRWVPIAATVVALVGGYLLWNGRVASVRIVPAFPPSGVTVTVDGKEAVPVPTSLELSPGSHEFVFHHKAFTDAPPTTRDVAAGADLEIPAVFDFKDAKDLAAVRQEVDLLVKMPGVSADDVKRDGEIKTLRGSLTRSIDRGDLHLPLVQLLIPRGEVRMADLSVFAITFETDPDPGQGTIEFRRGEEILWSQDAPGDTRNWVEMPAAVREKVREGDTITWTWIPAEPSEKVQPVSAEFHVVAPDPKVAGELRALEATLSKQSGALRPYYRGKILDRHGLQTAAFLDLYAAAEASPTDPAAWRGLRTVLQALDHKLTNALLDVDDWVHDVERAAPGTPRGPIPTFKPRVAKK